jgi:hypothetical protein
MMKRNRKSLAAGKRSEPNQTGKALPGIAHIAAESGKAGQELLSRGTLLRVAPADDHLAVALMKRLCQSQPDPA